MFEMQFFRSDYVTARRRRLPVSVTLPFPAAPAPSVNPAKILQSNPLSEYVDFLKKVFEQFEPIHLEMMSIRTYSSKEFMAFYMGKKSKIRILGGSS